MDAAEKKAQIQALAAAAAATKKTQRMLQADAAMHEEKAFADLQHGAEREAMRRQV